MPTRLEEQRMAISFGQEWRNCAKAVPAVIPRLGSMLEKPLGRGTAWISRRDAPEPP